VDGFIEQRQLHSAGDAGSATLMALPCIPRVMSQRPCHVAGGLAGETHASLVEPTIEKPKPRAARIAAIANQSRMR
jgi:hypothetical protein